MSKKKTIGLNPLDAVIPPINPDAAIKPALPENISAKKATPKASADGKSLRLSSLVLEDENGADRARIRASSKSVGLAMLDGKGRTRAELEINDDGAGRLSFADPAGDIRLLLEVDQLGRANILFGDAGQNLRIAVGISEDGESYFELIAADGETSLFKAP